MANPEHLAKLEEGVEAWNKWREENPDETPDLSKAYLRQVNLVDANLSGAYLRQADLRGTDLKGVNLRGAYMLKGDLAKANLVEVDLTEANLIGANLGGANLHAASLNYAKLYGANLYGANLSQAALLSAKLKGGHLKFANLREAFLQRADLRRANLCMAHLNEANLNEADLSKADLRRAYLNEADLTKANLNDADLWRANLGEACLEEARLHGANFEEANLQGAKIKYARLQGASFRRVEVDGSTMIWGCSIDRYRGDEEEKPSLRCTDFEGVGLGDIRIDKPGRQLLEYNVRRANWNRWYQGKKPWEDNRPSLPLRSCVKAFWKISDYGASTKGIISWFFILSFVFAAVYYTWGAVDQYVLRSEVDPGIVENLFVIEGQRVNTWLVPLRAFYFSIVTMTTLGFGDLYASTASLCRGIFGHLLLGFQVILGYVMLGALVTRFAVMFTGGGPAGKFAPTEKPPQQYPLWQIMGYFWL